MNQSSEFELFNGAGGADYHVIDKDIICTEFAPDVFAHLRAIDGYNVVDIQKSLSPEIEENVQRIFKAGEGMGKSGSFFFFSHDDNFLIKTMTMGDFKAFKTLFRAYFEHVNTYTKSLLARIYGVYSVKMDEQDPVYLILMGNSKKCSNSNIKKIYDLKGSLVKRSVDGDERTFKNTAVLKDKNLLRLKREEKALLFQQDDIEHIRKQMSLDISLLCHFNLMDYSLLFVIEYNPAYVQLYPSEFQRTADGQLIKPITPTAKKMKEMSNKDELFSSKAKKKEISEEFLRKLAGQDEISFHEKYESLHNTAVTSDKQSFLIRSRGAAALARESLAKRSFKETYQESLKTQSPHLYEKLLLGLTEPTSNWPEGRHSRHTFMSEDGMFIYHVGIIDYL